MPRPKLRNEFAGKRAGGSIIDFNNRRGRGALDRSARGFPAISYPSIDLLKVRLTRKQPDGSKQPDNGQPYWRVRDLSLVRKAVERYAQTRR